jgi:hypothetical protein
MRIRSFYEPLEECPPFDVGSYIPTFSALSWYPLKTRFYLLHHICFRCFEHFPQFWTNKPSKITWSTIISI